MKNRFREGTHFYYKRFFSGKDYIVIGKVTSVTDKAIYYERIYEKSFEDDMLEFYLDSDIYNKSKIIKKSNVPNILDELMIEFL